MRTIKLSYYKKHETPNFGDDLAPALVNHITGLDINHAEHAEADLFAVGSILGYWNSYSKAIRRSMHDCLPGRQPLALWGTGLIRPKRVVLPRCEVLALRGRLSQRYANLSGKEILLGDPGILAKDLVGEVEKTNLIGVVPHYVDKTHALIKSLERNPDYRVIDVERACEAVCRDIASCKVILSSSLHGLVVADAYGIPNARLVLSDQIIGGDFKFDDYASGVERKKITTCNPLVEKEFPAILSRLDPEKDCANQDIINRKCNELKIRLFDWLNKEH